MNIALMLNYVNDEKLIPLTKLTDNCLKLLNGLISYYEKASLK